MKTLLFTFFICIFISAVHSQCACQWYEAPVLSTPNSTGTNLNQFGFGNSLSVNKNILAIGAQRENGGLGTVRIYTRFSNFPYWTYRSDLTSGRLAVANGTNNFFFGGFVRVATDNNIVVIENGGSTNLHPTIYSYERSGPNAWVQVSPSFQLPAPGLIRAVGLYSNLLVIATSIGRPFTTYFYTKTNYVWNLRLSLPNNEGGTVFYSQVSVSNDNTVIAGTTSGNIHIMQLVDADGVLTVQNYNNFSLGGIAASVAISPSGAAAYAATTGNVLRFFTRTSAAVYADTGSKTDWNGYTFATLARVYASDNYLVVSDSGQKSTNTGLCSRNGATTGAVYTWDVATNGSYIPNHFLRPRALDDAFGSNIAFTSNQGNLIVAAGAYDYIYSFFEERSIAARPSCSAVQGTPSNTRAPVSPSASITPSPSAGVF